MAGSLDELMQFLLAEIALSGQQGSTVNDILGLISQFYQAHEDSSSFSQSVSREFPRISGLKIDRPYQEKVWRWLMRHPDVRIGGDGSGKEMSLAVAEAKYTTQAPSPTLVVEQAASCDSSGVTSNLGPPSGCINSTQLIPAQTSLGPRVLVNEDRMWLAICGHLKDTTKVFETEFALLSIIAARREAGILQGDLVKESGQDKRSVPKRTDALRDKGYIEKRIVHLRGLKTSRLVLGRFASTITKGLATSLPVHDGDQGKEGEGSINFDALIRRLFDVLKEKEIVTREDLRKETEMTTKWRARVLTRVIRKLEIVGCVKRVKAASEASKSVHYYFNCIKLLHEPSDRDLEAFHAPATISTHTHPVDFQEVDDDDINGNLANDPEGESLEEMCRVVPQWNPDRPLVNALQELVESAGVQGSTNRVLRYQAIGAFIRRPVEDLLARITTLWLQSQPPLIRHLAIIRDTTLLGTIPLYAQYSFAHFQARVDAGKAFWEGVKGTTTEVKNKGKRDLFQSTAFNTFDLEVDEFGFAADYNPVLQDNGAQATLGQAVLASQPHDLPFPSHDPSVHRNSVGIYTVAYNDAPLPMSEPRTVLSKTATARHGVFEETPTNIVSKTTDHAQSTTQSMQRQIKPRGRPRKFLRGTEKFWQAQFAMAKAQANNQKHRNAESKAGIMSDPAGLTIFAQRPPQFDATLVRAIEGGLPVPSTPEDITQSWVDQTLPILDRSGPGVYVSPKGARIRSLGNLKTASRSFIFRHPHLVEPKALGQNEVPTNRVLIPKAARSIGKNRDQHAGNSVKESEEQTIKQHISITTGEIHGRGQEDDLEQAPAELEGSVHHSRQQILTHSTPVVLEAEKLLPSFEGQKYLSPERRAQETTSELAKSSEETTHSHQTDNANNSNLRAAVTSSLSLPPPLTTRSALRRKRDLTSAELTPAEVQKRLLMTGVNREVDRCDLPPQSTSSEVQESTSKLEDAVHTPNTHDYLQSREDEGLGNTVTSNAAADEGTMSNNSVVSNPQQEIVETATEEPNPRPSNQHQTPEVPCIQRRQSAPLVLNLPHEPATSRVGYNDNFDREFDESHLEAYRLVQVLTAHQTNETREASQVRINHNPAETAEPTSQNEGGILTLPELMISHIDSDQEPPRKRVKQDGMGTGSVSILRRKILLDLMQDNNGVLPYHPKSLWNAFVTAWKKAGQAGKPDMRTIRTIVKSLCQNGSTKKMKFSHRNKKGIMVTQTILVSSEMAASHPVILETQRRMMDADPHPYFPANAALDPELREEVEKPPLASWPAVFEERTVETSTVPARAIRDKLRETLASARKARTSAVADPQDHTPVLAQWSKDLHRHPRLKGIKGRYARIPGPYERPRLSSLLYARPPQQPFSNQASQSPNDLQFRTEVSPVPLVFKAVAPPKKPQSMPPKIPSSRRAVVWPCTSSGTLSSTGGGIEQAQTTIITWTNDGANPTLPSSVEDILSNDRRRKRPDHAKDPDPAYRKFEWVIDGVARWEQRSLELFDSRSTNWLFINHLAGDGFQAVQDSESHLTFDGLIWYDQYGREHTEKRFHAVGRAIPEPLVTDGHGHGHSQGWSKGRAGKAQGAVFNPRVRSGKRKREVADVAAHVKKRRRGRSPPKQPQTILDSAGNQIDVSYLIGAKYQRPRGTQHLRTMPQDMIYKLTVAVVSVRALAGGLERHVDWPLVMRIFPDEEEDFLKDRWRTLSNKHRRDVNQLIENFQDKFPEAYAEGQVPQIDFNDLENVDWPGIVDWALNNLDKPALHEIPDLPATRSELDETVHMKIKNTHRRYRDFFGYNQAVTVTMKEAAIAAIPFAVPLLFSPPTTPIEPTEENNDSLSKLAKSWALSTITTPIDSFDAAKAHDKLQSLASTAKQSEKLIESALKSLSSARAVAKNREKVTDAKGRSYDLSRVFSDTLDQRRTINATMLQQAVWYKTHVLDPAFANYETVKFDPLTVEDGNMIALLNLAAHDRIKFTIGDDVPRNRWGVDQGSRNKSRSVSKEYLYFTVLIQHIPNRYVFGNPLLSLLRHRPGEEEDVVPIPALGAGDRDLIPIWRNIHGGFQREFWDLALSATLGIVASRSGASVKEVAEMMVPALEAWEIECLLEWCLAIGAVRKIGVGQGEWNGEGWTGGWEVKEWWWMVRECTGESCALVD